MHPFSYCVSQPKMRTNQILGPHPLKMVVYMFNDHVLNDHVICKWPASPVAMLLHRLELFQRDLFTVYWELFTAYRELFTAYRELFTAYRELFTAYRELFTEIENCSRRIENCSPRIFYEFCPLWLSIGRWIWKAKVDKIRKRFSVNMQFSISVNNSRYTVSNSWFRWTILDTWWTILNTQWTSLAERVLIYAVTLPPLKLVTCRSHDHSGHGH